MVENKFKNRMDKDMETGRIQGSVKIRGLCRQESVVGHVFVWLFTRIVRYLYGYYSGFYINWQVGLWGPGKTGANVIWVCCLRPAVPTEPNSSAPST